MQTYRELDLTKEFLLLETTANNAKSYHFQASETKKSILTEEYTKGSWYRLTPIPQDQILSGRSTVCCIYPGISKPSSASCKAWNVSLLLLQPPKSWDDMSCRFYIYNIYLLQHALFPEIPEHLRRLWTGWSRTENWITTSRVGLWNHPWNHSHVVTEADCARAAKKPKRNLLS